jgi:hypothetical protein
MGCTEVWPYVNDSHLLLLILLPLFCQQLTPAALRAGYAYCHSVDAFSWEVVGSVAGVIAAVVAIIGLIPLLRGRRQVLQAPAAAENNPLPAIVDDDAPVVVGQIPQEPLGFQPRSGLLAALDAPEPWSRVVVIYAVTGMRGVGKTDAARRSPGPSPASRTMASCGVDQR